MLWMFLQLSICWVRMFKKIAEDNIVLTHISEGSMEWNRQTCRSSDYLKVDFCGVYNTQLGASGIPLDKSNSSNENRRRGTKLP